MSIRSKITWLVVATALTATAILTVLGYTAARAQYLAGIDRQLTAAVEALPLAIGEDYLDRATGSEEFPAAEYLAMVQRLSSLAERSGVYYLYAFEQVGDQVVHLGTSASAAEREAGDWSAFREPYEQPPPALLQTFTDGKTRFAEYADEFGEFRSIFIRRSSRYNRPYVLGADVSLGEIRSDLSALVMRYVLAGSAVALLAGLLGMFLSRRISRPLRDLAREVQSWAAREFQPADAVRQQIGGLARDNRDEIGEHGAFSMFRIACSPTSLS